MEHTKGKVYQHGRNIALVRGKDRPYIAIAYTVLDLSHDECVANVKRIVKC